MGKDTQHCRSISEQCGWGSSFCVFSLSLTYIQGITFFFFFYSFSFFFLSFFQTCSGSTFFPHPGCKKQDANGGIIEPRWCVHQKRAIRHLGARNIPNNNKCVMADCWARRPNIINDDYYIDTHTHTHTHTYTHQ